MSPTPRPVPEPLRKPEVLKALSGLSTYQMVELLLSVIDLFDELVAGPRKDADVKARMLAGDNAGVNIMLHGQACMDYVLTNARKLARQ